MFLRIPDWYEEAHWSALALCEALGDKRGYMVSRGGGAPDVHRAGLEIIRDCVDGIVCLCFSSAPIILNLMGLNMSIKIDL